MFFLEDGDLQNFAIVFHFFLTLNIKTNRVAFRLDEKRIIR